MRDLLKSVADAMDLFNLEKDNWVGKKNEFEQYVASKTIFKSRTSLRKAIEIAKINNEDVIYQFNREEITLNEAFDMSKKEVLNEPDDALLALKKLEKDEEEASDKICAMYEKIQELKYKIKILESNPTPEEFEQERKRRIEAEKALEETQEFLMNHPSEINPESLKAEINLDLIESLVPDKNKCSIRLWNSYDKYNCRTKISNIVNKLSILDKELKGA